MHLKRIAQSKAGFSLLELLIAVSILAITAGVASDIILSLVRTYTKTKATNEIEQVGLLAISKVEKEIKTGTALLSSQGCSNNISFQTAGPSGSTVQIDYFYSGGTLTRSEGSGLEVPILSPSLTGVQISNPTADVFCVVQESPAVVHIKFVLTEASGGVTTFNGNITLEQTVVMRGTY